LPLRLGIWVVLVLLLVAGCGGERSDEDVVRAWSKALNSGNDEAAANLFAAGARIVQGPLVTTLGTHADAVRWNSGLPCAGRIVALDRRGHDITATFVLGTRKAHACDGPGDRAAALFRIQKGRIVLWHQVPPPDETSTGVGV
jgi:hypothetical protein